MEGATDKQTQQGTAARPDGDTESGRQSEAAANDFEAFLKKIQDVARYLGKPTSRTVLLSGLPVGPGELDLEIIEHMAARVGLEATALDPKSVSAGTLELPAIVEFTGSPPEALLALGPDGRYQRDLDGSNSASVSPDELRIRGIKRVIGFSAVYINNQDRAELGTGQRIENRHWLFGTLSTFWRGYLQVALAAIFINLIALASPLFIMNVYDRILPNNATSSLLALGIGVVIAFIFDLLLKFARSAIIDHTGRAADRKISHKLFDKVLNSTLASRPGSTGEYASRVNQFEFVREFFTSNTLSTLIDSAFVFIFVFVIYFLGGWIFTIPLIAFAIAVVIGLIAQYRIGKRVAKAANEATQRQALLIESISTIETVKSLRAEATLLRKWDELTKNSSKTSEKIKQLSASAANTTQFVQQLVSILIVIAGAYEFSQGRMSTGAIIACVMLSSRTVAPLSQIAMTLSRLRQATLSLKILSQVMEQPEDRPTSAGFVNRQVHSGRIDFQGVSFAYPETDNAVLRNLNLKINPGERVGIIGRIGSGKTTFGRLLGGLFVAGEGRLLIDGVDVRQYHPAEVRAAVSVAGQHADLFSGTLKENLLLGNANATDAEIVEAAKAAGVDEFASVHPLGYDLPVGERGNNLSGGQRQAVAIARLLLNKPKIVFLDEPTGSMDQASERQLIKTLSSAFGPDVTLVVATHRFSLLDIVDRLVVLDRGTVVADGPKDKVLSALSARARATGKQG